LAKEHVPYDPYRVDLAALRADMVRFREEMLTEMRTGFAQTHEQMADRQSDMFKGFTLILVTHLAATVSLTVTLVKLIP